MLVGLASHGKQVDIVHLGLVARRRIGWERRGRVALERPAARSRPGELRYI